MMYTPPPRRPCFARSSPSSNLNLLVDTRQQVLHMLTSAVGAGRAQAQHIALVALECPPANLCNPSAVTTTIDMFSTPRQGDAGAHATSTDKQLQQRINTAMQHSGPHSTCVVVDSIPAMCYHAADMIQTLADLCNHPHASSVLARVHKVPA